MVLRRGVISRFFGDDAENLSVFLLGYRLRCDFHCDVGLQMDLDWSCKYVGGMGYTVDKPRTEIAKGGVRLLYGRALRSLFYSHFEGPVYSWHWKNYNCFLKVLAECYGNLLCHFVFYGSMIIRLTVWSRTNGICSRTCMNIEQEPSQLSVDC